MTKIGRVAPVCMLRGSACTCIVIIAGGWGWGWGVLCMATGVLGLRVNNGAFNKCSYSDTPSHAQLVMTAMMQTT